MHKVRFFQMASVAVTSIFFFNSAIAAPVTKEVLFWQLLGQLASTPQPGGCQVLSVIDGTNFDKALSYPLTLQNPKGESDSMVFAKDAKGTVTVDSADPKSPHVWKFTEGNRDFKMVVAPGKGMTYISVAKFSCGQQQ